MEQYKLEEVTIDDENYFLAYVLQNEDWNGFVIPYFPIKEAIRLCDCINSNSDRPKATYDEKSDTFIVPEQIENNEFEDVEYQGEDIIIVNEKLHLYPIGVRSWIWSPKKE